MRTGILIDGDTTGAQRAIEQLSGSMDHSDAEAQKLAKAYGALDIAASRLATAQTAAKAATNESKLALAAGKITAEQYNKELLDTKTALDLVAGQHRKAQAELQRTNALTQRNTEMTGAQRAGMNQLSMQANDMATMWAMGASAQQIFVSQSGQVIQAVQLMTGGTSKLATFMMGPWGAAITTATVVLVPLISNLLATASAASVATAALDDLIQKRREEAAEAVKTTQAQIGLNDALNRRAELVEIIRKKSGVSLNPDGPLPTKTPQFAWREYQEYVALQQTIMEGEAALRVERQETAEKDQQNTQASIAARAKLAGAITAADKAQALYNVRIQEADAAYERSNKTAADQATLLAARTAAERDLNAAQEANRNTGAARIATLQRETVATGALIAGLYAVAAAYRQSSADGQRARIEAEATAQGIKKQADVQAYVAQQWGKYVAERVASGAEQAATIRDEAAALAHLNSQVEAGQISADEANQAAQIEAQTRPLLAARAREEGDAKAYLTGVIDDLSAAMLRNNAEQQRAQANAATIEMGKQGAQLLQEIDLTERLGARRLAALQGLNGRSLADELANINAEREKGMIRIRAEAEAQELRTRANRAGSDDLKTSLLEQAAAVDELANREMRLVDLEAQFEREARAVQFFIEQVDALAGALGGIKGPAGDIFSVLLSGNPTAALLGMGGIGSLAGLAMPGGTEALTKVEEEMTRALTNVFGEKAEGLAERIAGAAGGAAIGSWTGAAFFGDSKSGQAGAMAGGALGAAAFKDLASEGLQKALGSFGGPLASIAGSLLGGVLGKALSTTKRGSATFGDDGLVSTRGNSQSRITGATKAGNSAMDAFDALLEELGATASGIKFSAGIRKKDYVLDPTGAGRTKGAGVLNFGQDDQAWYEGMLREMFSDASFDGMSEGFQRLLKDPSADIKSQITKVLALQGNQDELAQRKDGQAYELAQLDKSTDKLRAYATEAGEGMAEVEELYALKRQDILDKYAEKALEQERTLAADRVTILQLEGKEAEARKAAFDLETEGLTGLELAQKQRIFDLTEEAIASAKAKEVADARRGLEIEIMQLEGDAIGALNAMRSDEKAAADASLGPLYDRRNALIDEAEAAAKAAAQGEKMTSLEIRLAQARGDDDLVEYLQRQQELRDATTDQERAYLKLIYAAEDATEKLDKVNQALAGIQSNYARGGKPDGEGGSAARIAEQAAEAEKARQSALDDLRSQLKSAYEAERAEIEKTIAALTSLKDEFEDFRRAQEPNLVSAEATYQQRQMEFIKLAALAGAGDQDAASRLTESGQAFIDVSQQRSSEMQFRRDVAMTLRSIEDVSGGLTRQIDTKGLELAELTRSVEAILGVEEQQKTTNQILRELKGEIAGMRSEQLQLGVRTEYNTRSTDQTMDRATLGGTGMRIRAMTF